MKAFVTGATGLLGNNLVRALVAAGHEVVGFVRSQDKATRLLGDSGARWVVGDIRDVSTYRGALAGIDVVFHTAAYFREYYQAGDHQQRLDDTNVKGTLDLLAAADDAGVRRVVHTSSGGTVGLGPDGSPGDEDTPPTEAQLRNLYFRSKHIADARIRTFAPKNGLAIIEILPGWMWGPGDAGPTGAGQITLDFLARKLPVIPPGGGPVVDARDVAAAMVRAAEVGAHGSRYIVAGAPLTLAEICAELETASGVRGPHLRISYGLAMIMATVSETWARLTGTKTLITRMGVRTMNSTHPVTSARAQREFGVTFRPFSETARDAVAWHRAHPM